MCASGDDDGGDQAPLDIAPTPTPPTLSAKQRMYLLDVFLSLPACPHAVLDAMDCVFASSSAASNVEITCRWFVLCFLKSNRREALVAARTFLSQHGRGLYVKPVIAKMRRLDRAFAHEIAAKNAPFWHAVIQAARPSSKM